MPPHLLAAQISTPNVSTSALVWLLVGIIIGMWLRGRSR